MTSSADRKAAERQRKESAGLVRVEIWVPKDRVAEVKKLAAQLIAKTG